MKKEIKKLQFYFKILFQDKKRNEINHFLNC